MRRALLLIGLLTAFLSAAGLAGASTSAPVGTYTGTTHLGAAATVHVSKAHSGQGHIVDRVKMSWPIACHDGRSPTVHVDITNGAALIGENGRAELERSTTTIFFHFQGHSVSGRADWENSQCFGRTNFTAKH